MATSAIGPQRVWLDSVSERLRELFDRDFDFWLASDDFGWVSASADSPASPVEFGDAMLTDNTPPDGLLDRLSKAGEADVARLSENRYLLAIPLGRQAEQDRCVATCVFETDMPEQLTQMGKLGQRFLAQEREVTRLGEENALFLRQVCEDFEELTFLRFMAERLSLGDGSNDIHEILDVSLGRLGEIAKAEMLCFLEGQSETTPRIEAIWRAEGENEPKVDPAVIVEIVESYREDCGSAPVIKNHLDALSGFLGVHEFILVEVSTSMSQVGWLLAINRVSQSQSASLDGFARWHLSQLEFGTNEASLLSTAATMLASYVSNVNLFQEREALLVNVVRALVTAMEAKDGYTCGHSERVARFAKRLARQVGYNEEECERIYLSGLLHDIGKIAISDAVLKKAGSLTEEEYAEIMKHPEEGWAILRELEQLSYVLPGILYHHERMDGRGYPDGLAGEEIPLEGRVIAVADAYDAMTSDRSYRKGMPQEKAEKILRGGAGTQWDKNVIEAFFEIAEEFSEIQESYESRKRPVREYKELSTVQNGQL